MSHFAVASPFVDDSWNVKSYYCILRVFCLVCFCITLLPFFSSCHTRWLFNRNTLRWHYSKISVGMWPGQSKRKRHKENIHKCVFINRGKKVNEEQMASEISSTKPNETHKKANRKRVKNNGEQNIKKRRLYHRSYFRLKFLWENMTTPSRMEKCTKRGSVLQKIHVVIIITNIIILIRVSQ